MNLLQTLLYQKCSEAKKTCYKTESTKSIVENLTKIQQFNSNSIMFCQADHFAFLIRTITSEPQRFTFERICAGASELPYASCSIINQSNLSHFKRNSSVIFAYDITPSTIAHLFPADSFSYRINFENDNAVSKLPSLWLNYKDFSKINSSLKTYNEVVCKTSSENPPFKPSAIICIDHYNKLSMRLAKDFNLKLILLKSCKETINNSGDITSNYNLVCELSNKLYQMGIPNYENEMLEYMNLY